MPELMGDFSKHFVGYFDVYDTFKASLDRLASEIDRRNRVRKQPFVAFHPRFLESSVSI